MKKFKFAFTVVEMITAMTVVGITAALVIPLSANISKKYQSGIVLGRAVEQIVQGNKDIIQLANSNNLEGAYTDELGVLKETDIFGKDGSAAKLLLDSFQTYVVPFWALNNTEILPNNVLPLKNFSGVVVNDVDSQNITNAVTFIYNFLHINASVAIIAPNGNLNPQNSSSDTGYLIYIDTTGFERAPNIYGKDVFAFHLINDGSVRPFDNTDANNGLEFTESVVRNNFRITYY